MPLIYGKDRFRLKRQCGFSLFEVLIALLVLAIGLIGLATLQSIGIRNNDSASRRTEATFLAQDISDRMRANMSNAKSLAGNYTDLVANYDLDTNSPPTAPACGGPCSLAQRADIDGSEWATAVTSLPGGRGFVGQSGNFFLITIMWDDERTGAGGTDCDGDPAVDLTCFHTLFRP